MASILGDDSSTVDRVMAYVRETGMANYVLVDCLSIVTYFYPIILFFFVEVPLQIFPFLVINFTADSIHQSYFIYLFH